MAKKKSWFNLLKRIFISESESRLEKAKRKRWVFARLKIRRLAASSALSPPRERRHQKAEEKQSKPTINVDAERIAEANAAAKTPEVEAEMDSLKEGTESIHEPKDEAVGLSKLTLHDQVPQYFYLYERKIEHLAAIKIQTAFRGYLARKALRALKALVRLQAIVRGRAVRRQAIATLKSLQSIVNIQSEVCAKRCDLVKTTVHCQENTLLDVGEKDIKIDLNSQRRWDNRFLSKEETNKLFSSKREAAIKRERIREYWLSHRRSTETEINGRRRYWLEQWVDAQLAKRDDLKNLDTLFSARNKEEFERKEIKPRTLPKQYHTDQELVSPIYVPRRSFHHRRQHSSGDDNSFMGSPALPTYMAATESLPNLLLNAASSRRYMFIPDSCLLNSPRGLNMHFLLHPLHCLPVSLKTQNPHKQCHYFKQKPINPVASKLRAAVIGGGPAGSSAAEALASGGVETFLFERSPATAKPCGGAIPLCMLDEFSIPYHLIDRRVTQMRIISPSNLVVDFGKTLKPHEFIAMLRREVLDSFLRRRAESSGATLMKALVTNLVVPTSSHEPYVINYTMDNCQRQLAVDVIVGADGANSRVAKSIKAGNYATAIAFQERIKLPEDKMGYYENLAEMYVGNDVSPDFYAWVFPKCDHVAVGTGTVCSKSNIKLFQHGIRARVRPKIDSGRVIKVEAHPIPEHPRPVRVRGRVALVGDAAGYVTKCSGEGIYFAAKSGRICGEAIVKVSEGGEKMISEDDLKREYLRKWDDKYFTTFKFLDILQKVFYGSNAAREALVELCGDEYVQRMTFDSYLYKKLASGNTLNDAKMVMNTISSLVRCNIMGREVEASAQKILSRV